jgi:uncharacterized protein YbaR (Trm112 family)
MKKVGHCPLCGHRLCYDPEKEFAYCPLCNRYISINLIKQIEEIYYDKKYKN